MNYETIHSGFPQVYHDPANGYLVSARSRKLGINIRKWIKTKSQALELRQEILNTIKKHGSQPDIPKDVQARADMYSLLVERLKPFGASPEDAASHYAKYLASEALRAIKPTVAEMVDKYEAHKLLEKRSRQYINEIKVHCRFLKRIWGKYKIDELRKNQIEKDLIAHHSHKNTRKKYLTFARMFFKFVMGEDAGYIISNPTIGIKIKSEDFGKEIYTLEQLKSLFLLCKSNYPQLLGYYSLQCFAGLRPSEAARVQWEHYNADTKELHIIKGKTDASVVSSK